MQVYHQAHDEENPLEHAAGKLAGSKPGLPRTARKALGNITNTARLGEPHLPAGKQTPGGKQALGRQTPGAKLQASARKGRALGDITNLSKPPLRPQAAKQAAAQPASTQERHQRQQTALSRPALQPLASPTYDEPIEALAGKGWRQMAREAEEREDQEIAERVRNLWRILPPTPEPSALSVLKTPVHTYAGPPPHLSPVSSPLPSPRDLPALPSCTPNWDLEVCSDLEDDCVEDARILASLESPSDPSWL